MRRNRAAFVIAAVVFTTLLVVGAAFGAVTVFNIERTSETIREQDSDEMHPSETVAPNDSRK